MYMYIYICKYMYVYVYIYIYSHPKVDRIPGVSKKGYKIESQNGSNIRVDDWKKTTI